MAFLTGSFGPTRHYPAFLRAIGDVLPLKYFIDIMNAVYLRGHAHLDETRAQSASLRPGAHPDWSFPR